MDLNLPLRGVGRCTVCSVLFGTESTSRLGGDRNSLPHTCFSVRARNGARPQERSIKSPPEISFVFTKKPKHSNTRHLDDKFIDENMSANEIKVTVFTDSLKEGKKENEINDIIADLQKYIVEDRGICHKGLYAFSR